MRRITAAGAIALFFVAGLATPAFAADPAPAAKAPAVAKAAAKKSELKFKLGGAYAIWGLNQNQFLLGKDHPLNNADYVVQMFRLALKVQKGPVGGFLRLDAAQGWWGVNNSPNVNQVVTQDPTTKDVTLTNKYNAFALFQNKDSNYPVHVDMAYIFMDDPLGIPVNVKIGRQQFQVGNRLVLDQQYEGITAASKTYGGAKLRAFWAKVSEGTGSYKNPTGKLMNDDDAMDDADLYGGILDYKRGKHSLQLFGLSYQDNAKDWAFLPMGFGYFRSRFQPQITQAMAFGLSAKGTLAVMQGLDYVFEADYLMGKDDIDNKDYAGNLIDKNDGTLAGFNVYAKLTQKMKVGVPLDVSLLFGMGSGDDDVTGGAGNINKIQTMGFFPLTNVWEDSVMPDIGGITPQGLGSPVSRGYREFENTTAVQVKVGAKVLKKARIEASYTMLKATNPITGWDAKGPTTDKSDDIGQEIDVNLKIGLLPGLKYVALFGFFQPGDGAAYLINGNTTHKEDVWELKQVLLYKF